jgi:hypothetical protein
MFAEHPRTMFANVRLCSPSEKTAKDAHFLRAQVNIRKCSLSRRLRIIFLCTRTL